MQPAWIFPHQILLQLFAKDLSVTLDQISKDVTCKLTGKEDYEVRHCVQLSSIQILSFHILNRLIFLNFKFLIDMVTSSVIYLRNLINASKNPLPIFVVMMTISSEILRWKSTEDHRNNFLNLFKKMNTRYVFFISFRPLQENYLTI